MRYLWFHIHVCMSKWSPISSRTSSWPFFVMAIRPLSSRLVCNCLYWFSYKIPLCLLGQSVTQLFGGWLIYWRNLVGDVKILTYTCVKWFFYCSYYHRNRCLMASKMKIREKKRQSMLEGARYILWIYYIMEATANKE